jgi:hypothetical protein
MFCSKSMSHRPSVAFLVRLADGENDVSGEENGGIGDDIGVGDAHVEGRGAIWVPAMVVAARTHQWQRWQWRLPVIAAAMLMGAGNLQDM